MTGVVWVKLNFEVQNLKSFVKIANNEKGVNFFKVPFVSQLAKIFIVDFSVKIWPF